MNNPFNRFENFGSIADKEKRKHLAFSIYRQLKEKSAKGIDLADSDTENFSSAIDKILSNGMMKELTCQDPALAEKITHEVLDFVNKAKKEINVTENPYTNEKELLEEFSKTNREAFLKNWKQLNSYLKQTYSSNEIDRNFYFKEFRKCLDKTNKINFESVKEHLQEKWQKYLFAKQTQHELNIIDKWRKKFTEELYKRIEELKKFQELLDPFTNELGRLFDMSKGSWHKADFDVLKRYAELLKQDKSLQELAEMLGRMQQVEKEYEEEHFSKTIIKPEWKADYSSKSDLIGVKESDDLTSMLPSETVLLSEEHLEHLFFKKYAEKKLQTFEYEGKMLNYLEEEIQERRRKEKEGAKGTFIICVDTSGSMHGAPETIAKSLCFAILKIAIRENRKCYLISFSTGIETLDLTDLKNSLEKIIEFLSMSFHGGTDASAAMYEALRQLQTNEYKKADVLMISDFVMPAFNKQTQEEIKAAKERRVKFHSLVIGTSENRNTISDFDNNWFYKPESREGILALVKNIKTL